MITFSTKEEKAIDVWAYVLSHGSMSLVDLARILYLADKEHFNDWGRPIYGENYLATTYGPIASTLKNYAEGNYAFSSIMLKNKYSFTISDNVIETTLKPDLNKFSKSDLASLNDNIQKVLINKENCELEFFDRSWYCTSIGSIIDWSMISKKEMSEEQIEDLHFVSRHIVF